MMITDVEQLFMCILVIYMPSLEGKWIFRCPAYSEITVFAFVMLCCRSFFCIFWTFNSLSDVEFADIFSHSVGGFTVSSACVFL